MSNKIKSLDELRQMKKQVYHTIMLREYAENADVFAKKVGADVFNALEASFRE